MNKNNRYILYGILLIATWEPHNSIAQEGSVGSAPQTVTLYQPHELLEHALTSFKNKIDNGTITLPGILKKFLSTLETIEKITAILKNGPLLNKFSEHNPALGNTILNALPHFELYVHKIKEHTQHTLENSAAHPDVAKKYLATIEQVINTLIEKIKTPSEKVNNEAISIAINDLYRNELLPIYTIYIQNKATALNIPLIVLNIQNAFEHKEFDLFAILPALTLFDTHIINRIPQIAVRLLVITAAISDELDRLNLIEPEAEWHRYVPVLPRELVEKIKSHIQSPEAQIQTKQRVTDAIKKARAKLSSALIGNSN